MANLPLYKTMLSTLVKIFVQQFYRQNAGFFLLLLVFGLGITRPSDHLFLMAAALQSYPVLAGLVFVWALYQFKTTWFVLQQFSLPTHTFLCQLLLYPQRLRYAWGLYIQFILNLPVFLYAMGMFILGIYLNTWPSLFWMFLYLSLSSFLTVLLYERSLFRPGISAQFFSLSSLFPGYANKATFLFFIFYLFQKQPVLLLMVKGFSILLIALAMAFSPEQFKDNPAFAFIFLLTTISHYPLATQYHLFEYNYLSLSRNLPLSSIHRWGKYYLTCSLLFIPELLLYVRHLGESANALFFLQAFFFQSSLLLLIHSCLYMYWPEMEKTAAYIFIFFIGYFFGVMPWLGLLSLTFIHLTASLAIVHIFYYRAEYPVVQQEEAEME